MEEKKNCIKTPCGEISWGKFVLFLTALTIMSGWITWLIRTGDNSAKIPKMEEKIGSMDTRLVRIETAQVYQIEEQKRQSGQIDKILVLAEKNK